MRYSTARVTEKIDLKDVKDLNDLFWRNVDTGRRIVTMNIYNVGDGHGFDVKYENGHVNIFNGYTVVFGDNLEFDYDERNRSVILEVKIFGKFCDLVGVHTELIGHSELDDWRVEVEVVNVIRD